MEHRNKLNPEHSLRTAKGIKGTRQKIIVLMSSMAWVKSCYSEN